MKRNALRIRWSWVGVVLVALYLFWAWSMYGTFGECLITPRRGIIVFPCSIYLGFGGLPATLIINIPFEPITSNITPNTYPMFLVNVLVSALFFYAVGMGIGWLSRRAWQYLRTPANQP